MLFGRDGSGVPPALSGSGPRGGVAYVGHRNTFLARHAPGANFFWGCACRYSRGDQTPFMHTIGYHVMLRLLDDRVLTPDRAAERELARIILSYAEMVQLLAFYCADTHLHVEVATDLRTASEFVRRIRIAIYNRMRPGVTFQEPRYKPIGDQYHLEKTYLYILDQARRHHLPPDPLRESTNLPDLLGLRILGSYTRELSSRLLPRVSHDRLIERLGLPKDPGPEPPLVDILPQAVCAACGIHDLRARGKEEREARIAAVHAVSGLSRPQLAEMFGVDISTVGRARASTPDPLRVAAIQGQIDLRKRVGSPSVKAARFPDTPASAA